jgi:hypothetical protein
MVISISNCESELEVSILDWVAVEDLVVLPVQALFLAAMISISVDWLELGDII